MEGPYAFAADSGSTEQGGYDFSNHRLGGGAGGLIMRYTGGQWSVVTSPTTNHIVSLAKVPNSEEEELWASVWKAPLLHYKGGSWQSVANPVGNNSHFISMAFLSSTDGWAGAANQGFYHYDGVNWQYRTENNGALAFSGINLLSPTNGWSLGGYYFAHFDGQTWRMTQQNVNVSLSSLSMASETEGWAVGGEGTIWRYKSELGLSRCLSGRVTTDKGPPLANVTIADGHGNTAITGPDGYYYFNGLAADTYTLTPSFGGYLFYPLKRTVNLVTYTAGQDFAALIDMEDYGGDGLPNAWEVLGYDANGDGIIDVDLPALGANPLSLVFTDRSVGAATAWLWDFGDGTTSTERNPSHSYMTFGSYTVKLTVTGPDGSDTLIKQRESWTLKNILYLPLILR